MAAVDPIRRIDLDDETLLLDGAGGRVVRLRGAARAAVDRAESPDARAAREHLVGLGVLPAADRTSGDDAAGDVSRRSVLSVSAAAALGVTVMALPAAAAAVSPGGQSVRTGFVQVGEYEEPGGVAPSYDLTRSFSHGGKIHLLDYDAPWRMYVFTSSLDAVAVVNVTSVPVGGDWQYPTDFIVAGDYAYIAATRGRFDTDVFIDVVRLSLPLAPVDGAVAATVWSIPLNPQQGPQDLSGRTWAYTDGEGTGRTLTGPSSVSWGANVVLLERAALASGTLRLIVRYSSPGFTVDGVPGSPLYYVLEKTELLTLSSISGAGAPTTSFAEVAIDLVFDGWSGGLRPTEPTSNLVLYGAFTAVVRGGDLLLFADDFPSIAVFRIPLEEPTSWTVVRGLALPSGLNSVSGPNSDYAPSSILVGTDRLVTAGQVEQTDGTYRAAVMSIDLTQTPPVIDEHLLIGGSGSYSWGTIVADATYFYVGLWNEDNLYAVARVTRSPLALDGTAVTGLDGFLEHYAYTAQPTATGVMTAGSGLAPIATFAFVEPS